MPVDRLFHPTAGHSNKVSTLSHFDFRVWWTYVLAADDFGVMRKTALTIQAANRALADQPKKLVDAALDTLIRIGLLVAFDHQGEAFVCQLTWQDFQKIRYPRGTLMPLPPPEIILKCSSETQELFRKHSRKISEGFPPARTRETANGSPANGSEANGKRQTANGLEEGSGEKPSALEPAGFLAFWDAYPNKTRRAEAEGVWRRLAPDGALSTQILAAVTTQRRSAQWTRDSGRFIPNPAKWLTEQRWRDEGTAAQPAVVSSVTRQNRANADEAKRLMRARHGRS